MSRAAYHAAYYRDTAPRRRRLATANRQAKRWLPWLLQEVLADLARPEIAIVPTPRPIRRPLLRLRRA